MKMLNVKFVDEITKKCIESYYKLPKTGKPTTKEWTVLSCLVKIDTHLEKPIIEVVSLGTGSKCIGATKMCPKGLILNDSHAEVMARRGFLVYLYDNIEKAFEGNESIFTIEDNKCKLKDNIIFVFYSSQFPCGDASIIPMSTDNEQFGDILSNRKRNNSIDIETSSNYDCHRTGAKCLPDSEQDPKGCGINYHILGKVRTKPGRGDRTLSVSCSDKIARWIHLGLQGSLINMLLLEPIYIKSFIFGSKVQFHKESLDRALLNRDLKEDSRIVDNVPQFYESTRMFPNMKDNENKRPAPGSIVWIKLDQPVLEVAILGKKLGVTKKNKNLVSSSLCISKASLFRRFIAILKKNVDLKQSVIPVLSLNLAEYDNVKSYSKDYYRKWLLVKTYFFKTWTVKPKMWNFNEVEN